MRSPEEIYNKVASDNAQNEIEAFNKWCGDNGWKLKNGLCFKDGVCKVLAALYPLFLLQYEKPDLAIQAMQKYADQEKEAEAVAFAEWIGNNDWVKVNGAWEDCYLLVKGNYTTSELYQIFKQQTGGK